MRCVDNLQQCVVNVTPCEKICKLNFIKINKEIKQMKKKSLMALGFLLGMGLATPALAFEIGDLITPGVEAHGNVEAVISKFAEQDDVITSFIINPELVEEGDMINSLVATQTDVDALLLKTNPAYVDDNTLDEFIVVKVGDIIEAREATRFDIAQNAMINSDIVDFTTMKFGQGVEGDSVIIGGVLTGGENNFVGAYGTVFDRVAVQNDVDNGVYSNGTVVALGDPVFAGRVISTDVGTYYNADGSLNIAVKAFRIYRPATQADVDASTTETTPGVKDLAVGSKINTGQFDVVNGKKATFNQWIGERTAGADDVTAIVLGDDGKPVELNDVISARAATYADVAANALIDPTELEVGDLVFYGYADADDVAAKKLTGVELVKKGDTIFSREATNEDVSAGAITGDRIINFSELIPGAIVVDAAFLEANPNFKIGDKTVVDGDVIFLSVDASAASDAIPPVFYTAGMAIDDEIDELITEITNAAGIELSDAELEALVKIEKAEMKELSPGVTDLNRLKVVRLMSSLMSENPDKIDDVISAVVNPSKTTSKTGKMLLAAGYAMSHEDKAFSAYSDTLYNGITAEDFRTKITPDVSSGAAVAGVGSSVVTSSINNHQGNIIANSGNYGSKNISVVSLSGDTGVASGSTSMNTSVWGEMFVSDSTMGMRDGVAGYDANAGGFTIGVDAVVNPVFTVGFATSYADISVNGNSIANSKTETDQFQGTLYGVMMMEDFFVNGSVAYAVSSSNTSRTTFGGTAKGSYNTNIYSVDLGVGMPISNGNMLITPQIGISYSSINPNSYSETGSAALNVSAESMSMLGIKAGIAVDTKLKLNAGTLVPKLRLIADWDILRERAESTASWVSTGITIATTNGPKPSALGGVVGLGFDYVSDDGAYVLSLDYDLTTKSDFISHAGSAKVRLNF